MTDFGYDAFRLSPRKVIVPPPDDDTSRAHHLVGTTRIFSTGILHKLLTQIHFHPVTFHIIVASVPLFCRISAAFMPQMSYDHTAAELRRICGRYAALLRRFCDTSSLIMPPFCANFACS